MPFSFIKKRMNEVTSLLQENKRIMNVSFVRNYESIFACPICHSSMKVSDLKSLICLNLHTFDFAKQGYINLTTRYVKSKYSKELFEARRKLFNESDFFESLSQTIANVIKNHIGKTKKASSILDMGCGEGSHLDTICNIVNSEHSHKVIGVGIDLSKEGILIAAKNYSEHIWAVADLANTPFKQAQFDYIVNILSPSNYAEFNRLLHEDGLVIKVVPQSGYLIELREHLSLKPEKTSYSNKEIVERFTESFQLVDISRLSYKARLNKSSLQSLVQMTPLTWGTTEERVKSFIKDSAQITIDFDLLVGKKQV